jgi:hypothetical protein
VTAKTDAGLQLQAVEATVTAGGTTTIELAAYVP